MRNNFKIIKITHDPWQDAFLKSKGDKILCTGRQVGKTEICAEDAVEWAIENPKSQPIVMIAPVERQSYALFEKTLNYLINNYPDQIKMGKDRPTHTKITLKSGLRIYCLPVGISGLGIRFVTIGRLYVDEASRIPEEVWTAIIPALLTTGGASIYLSTPFGKQGEFYACWINKDGAYDSFTRFSISSEKVMAERKICETWTILQKEKALQKLAQAKSRWTKEKYAQEYLGAFTDALKQFFSEELIKKVCILKRRKTIIKERNYYMGMDVAGMGGSENAFEIFDKISKINMEQVENKITKFKYTTETTRTAILYERLYKNKQIGVDDGGPGFGVFSEMMEAEETKRKTIALNNASRSLNNEDSQYKKILKEDMYQEALMLMEQGKVKLLDDQNIIDSLRSVIEEFVVKEKYPTERRIYGDYTHITEGIIRALWLCSQDKRHDLWIR